MLTVTLRGVAAHKLRLILTTASIALGIAFLAGTLVLTDTMSLAFNQLFGQVSSGTDAVVRTKAPYVASDGIDTSRPPVGASVLSTVTGVDGVRVAEGSVSGYALLTDNKGKAVVTSGGAPTMGYSLPADEALRGDVVLRSGKAPGGPHEVAIDATSATSHHIALGSTITILFVGPPQDFTVVGTVGYGHEPDLGGTTSAYFDTRTAQSLLGDPGFFDKIDVAGDPGLSQSRLAARIEEAVPDGVEAVTGVRAAQESSDAIQAELGIVGILFLIFAGIALFVGSFIIWNTFTMIVTQRSREIALLRAIGATRRQVLRGLVLEAILIGLAASAVGVVLGVGVARGLQLLMDALGFGLPTTSLQVQPSTVGISLLVGTLVTVVAALVPARRATKVLPVEALRESVPASGAVSRSRAVIGLTLACAGVAGMLAVLYGGAPMPIFALGLVGALVGVMVALPLVVRPLASLIAVPLRLRRLPGDLAWQNATRNARRTASTAAALMIGLTLVVGMSVFASSLKSSLGAVLTGQTNADLFLRPSSEQGPGFSPSAVGAVRDVPGVATVSGAGWGETRFDGAASSFSAVDPATVESVMNLEVSQGSFGDLGADGVVVSRAAAETHRWVLGDPVQAEFAATGEHRLRVVGIYDGKGLLTDDFILSLDEQSAFAGPQLLTSAFVVLDPGVDRGHVQDLVAAALAGHPDTRVLDQEQFEKVSAGFIDSLLTFVTVMLLLAVVIALLGIINTLALSVHERTRELGLLRAVGMTRGQVRAMVRWEAVVISLIGALMGAALGIAVGLALAKALESEGVTTISVPGLSIAAYVVLAGFAGVLAAIAPARSAAKVDVLRAVVVD